MMDHGADEHMQVISLERDPMRYLGCKQAVSECDRGYPPRGERHKGDTTHGGPWLSVRWTSA